MPFDKTDPRPLDWKMSEAFRDVEKLEAAAKKPMKNYTPPGWPLMPMRSPTLRHVNVPPT